MGGKHDYSKLDSIYHSFNRWLKLGFNGRIPFQPCNIPLYGKFTVFKSDLYLGAFVSNLADYIGFDIWRNFAYSCTVCSLKEKRIYQKRYILFLWRRGQDLNLRRLMTSHAFQACALNHSATSACKYNSINIYKSQSVLKIKRRFNKRPFI